MWGASSHPDHRYHTTDTKRHFLGHLLYFHHRNQHFLSWLQFQRNLWFRGAFSVSSQTDRLSWHKEPSKTGQAARRRGKQGWPAAQTLSARGLHQALWAGCLCSTSGTFCLLWALNQTRVLTNYNNLRSPQTLILTELWNQCFYSKITS